MSTSKKNNLVIPPGFYFVPLSGTYSSAASFCLSGYLYFYVCGSLGVSLNLGEVTLCRWHPVCLGSSLPSYHPSCML